MAARESGFPVKCLEWSLRQRKVESVALMGRCALFAPKKRIPYFLFEPRNRQFSAPTPRESAPI